MSSLLAQWCELASQVAAEFQISTRRQAVNAAMGVGACLGIIVDAALLAAALR